MLERKDQIMGFGHAMYSVRFLLIAGRRLNEPVARGGPFVMNTRQEVMQAFRDFKNNRFQE
jgi:redox-sensitive bicupin YhaK (pirin superfamily)